MNNNDKALDLVPESFFVLPKECVFKSPRSVYYVEEFRDDGWDMDKEFRYIMKAVEYKMKRQREGRLLRITDGDGCPL